MSEAYAVKYPTKASEKWVRGFAEAKREAVTLVGLPAPEHRRVDGDVLGAGRGWATSATKALVTRLLATGVDEVVAYVHPDHAASEAVAHRAGLAPTGRLHDGEQAWVLVPSGPGCRRSRSGDARPPPGGSMGRGERRAGHSRRRSAR